MREWPAHAPASALAPESGLLGDFWSPTPAFCCRARRYQYISAWHCKVKHHGDDPIDSTRGKKTPFYHVVVTIAASVRAVPALRASDSSIRAAARIKLRLDVARIGTVEGRCHMSDRVKQLLTVYRKQAA